MKRQGQGESAAPPDCIQTGSDSLKHCQKQNWFNESVIPIRGGGGGGGGGCAQNFLEGVFFILSLRGGIGQQLE
jgi:hypothetical protein